MLSVPAWSVEDTAGAECVTFHGRSRVGQAASVPGHVVKPDLRAGFGPVGLLTLPRYGRGLRIETFSRVEFFVPGQ